jgi:hypothetical protein
MRAGCGVLSAATDPSSGAVFVRATFSHKGKKLRAAAVHLDLTR